MGNHDGLRLLGLRSGLGRSSNGNNGVFSGRTSLVGYKADNTLKEREEHRRRFVRVAKRSRKTQCFFFTSSRESI